MKQLPTTVQLSYSQSVKPLANQENWFELMRAQLNQNSWLVEI